jgi:hypothetical protein
MAPLQLTETQIKLDTPANTVPSAENDPQPTGSLLRRLWGSTLVVVGYLLSPLCWWNDLVINLPLALGFGYLVSRPWPDALVPMTGVGYWLTNVVGFVLMQQGAVTALQKEGQGSKSQSLRNGLITSTVYTVAIVVLIQFHILEMPDFLNGDLLATLDAVLPDWLMAWMSV